MPNYFRVFDRAYQGTEFEQCPFIPVMSSSGGSLHIQLDKVTEPEFNKLITMSEDQRLKAGAAIKRFVEPGGRRSKEMLPFLNLAQAFKTAFKKRQRITFDGERLKSQGHLRMPKNTADLMNNPLFVEDLGAFFPFRDHNEKPAVHWKELKEKHPHLEIEESLYRKTKSPVVAFDLFIKSVESGVYPPVDLLQWVAAGMKQFIDSDGKQNLNNVFGFEKSGRGFNRTNAFDKVRETKSEGMELLYMAVLIDYFDLNIPDAAEFMARTRSPGEYESGDTYIRKWYSEWNDLCKNHDQFRSIYESLVLKRSGRVDDESKLRFLEKFGPYGKKNDYLPESIRRFLVKHGKLKK